MQARARAPFARNARTNDPRSRGRCARALLPRRARALCCEPPPKGAADQAAGERAAASAERGAPLTLGGGASLSDVVDAAYKAAPASAGGVADTSSDCAEVLTAGHEPASAMRVEATLETTPEPEPVVHALVPITRLQRHPRATLRGCVREILAICVPAMGAILADPVMSLVDTACIGRISSVQLAALAPNTAVFNFVFAALYFLQTAVTALCARALGAGDRARAGQAFSVGAFLAITLGVGATLCLEAFAPTLLALMSTSPEFVAPALTYLRIRALAAPAVLTCMVVQGACYARANARAPLVINLTAGAVNLVGDIFLVFGPLKMGIAGAAWATVAGQYVAAALCIWTVVSGQRDGSGLPLMRRMPTRAQLTPFFRIAGVMITRLLCIMSVYTLATRSAVALGTLPAAAFQVGLELVWFLSFFPEPLSMAAQALLARLPPGINFARQVAVKSRAVLTVGAALACALVLVLNLTPFSLFTSDAAVIATLDALRLPMSVATFFCCFAMALDGVFIGLGNFSHLAAFQALNLTVMLPYFVLYANSLYATFAGLALFFMLRFTQHCMFIALRCNPFRDPLRVQPAADAARDFKMAGAAI